MIDYHKTISNSCVERHIWKWEVSLYWEVKASDYKTVSHNLKKMNTSWQKKTGKSLKINSGYLWMVVFWCYFFKWCSIQKSQQQWNLYTYLYRGPFTNLSYQKGFAISLSFIFIKLLHCMENETLWIQQRQLSFHLSSEKRSKWISHWWK